MSILRNGIVVSLALIFAISVRAGVIADNLPVISYVSFESPDLQSPLPFTISGQLRVPTSNEDDSSLVDGGLPAVVILHGSASIDSRGSFYAQALNEAGIVTLEIDMWGARGLTGGGDRPQLPTLTVPDAFSALKYLAENPAIDPERIGVLGFSWGGVVSMLAANNHYAGAFGEGLTFAGHVAHYPVCWGYNIGIPGIFFDNLTGNPVLIQIGDLDDYDEGAIPCESLAAPFDNVSVNVFPNAHHAWDRLQPELTVSDPFSHLGAGGEVDIVPNVGKAYQSRNSAVTFFSELFGME